MKNLLPSFTTSSSSALSRAIKISQFSLLSACLFVANAQAEMVFHRGNCAEPQSLDPQMSGDVQSGHILRDLFEGLIAEDKDGKLVPGIAKDWNISDDGLVYTFHLRDSQWTDGTPLTAQDFVYALQRAVSPETSSDYTFLLYPIKNAQAIAKGEEKDKQKLGVKALDEKTLEITLRSPTPYFLSLLTNSISYPVPQAVVEKYGKDWTKPQNIVSNGAFSMTKWTPNDRIELVKSKNYWDKAAVKLDKIIYYPIEDKNAELNRFRAGELEWTCEISADEMKFIKENLADSFKVANSLGVYFYGFNTTKKPFKDNLPLRKALSLAIDRDIIVNKVLGAGEAPAYNFVVPGVMNAKPYAPEYASWTQAQRNELAKKLYKEAGYSSDKPLTVELRYNTSENHKKVAIAVAAMWKSTLGVQTKMVNEEWKVFLQNRKQKNTQVFRSSWIGDYNDANTFLDLFVSNSGKNDVGFKSKKFDDLIQQASQTRDMEKRTDLLQAAEKDFIDSYSLAPIYFYVEKRLVSPRLKGYTINIMNHSRAKYMWVEDKK